MGPPLLVATLLTLGFIAFAGVTAVRTGRVLLWRRSVALLALVYAAGASTGAWPWDAAVRPAYALLALLLMGEAP